MRQFFEIMTYTTANFNIYIHLKKTSGFLIARIRRAYMDFNKDPPTPDDPFFFANPNVYDNPFEGNIDDQFDELDAEDANEFHHSFNDFKQSAADSVGPVHGLDQLVKNQQAREITYLYTIIWTLQADSEERYNLLIE